MNCFIASEQAVESLPLRDAAVVIVGDTALFREGLRHVFARSPFDVVAAIDRLEGSDAAALAADALVLLLSIDPERPDTPSRIAEARMLYPQAAIVCLCTSCAETQVLPLLEAGVAAILLRTVAAETLVQTLELVLLGQRVVPYLSIPAPRESVAQAAPAREATPAAGRQSRDPYEGPQSPDGRERREPQERRACGENFRLSTREIRIIACLVKGESNRMIADHLVIDEGRVRGHVKAILRKIQVKNRTQAAIWGMKHLVGTEMPAGCDGRFDPAAGASCEGVDEEELPSVPRPHWQVEPFHVR